MLDLVYLNESASISANGLSGWSVFNNFTYGPVPNPGTYPNPIPMDQQMRLAFTLERPIGSILYAWTLIVDGCNTGIIIHNGPVLVVPTLPGWSIPGLVLSMLLTGMWIQRTRTSDLGLPPSVS